MQEITRANFDTVLLQSPLPAILLVVISSSHCPICEQNKKVLTGMEAGLQGKITLACLDAAAHPEITQEQGVSQGGSLLFFKGGTRVAMKTGIQTTKKLTAAIQEVFGLTL